MNMETTYHPSSTDDDLLPIVDEENRLLGCATRGEVHRRRLRHRAVHIVVHDGAGGVLLQKRSTHKDSFPGWWDISVGGHVDFGEMYAEAAAREIREELGVSGELREVARRHADATSGWEFVRIYDCHHAGPFCPPPAEIEMVRWVSARELLAHNTAGEGAGDWRVTPSGLASIRLWAAALGIKPCP